MIDKAHLDYLNRIMETKARLSCELKDHLNKKQHESMEEIKRFVQNEQDALAERMERSASPHHYYRAISEHIENLQNFVAGHVARHEEERDKSKIKIIEKNMKLLESNQYKLQDLHERFIVPMRNCIQCVATNQHLPNVGDTIEFKNGVFNEKFGTYQQYCMQDDLHAYESCNNCDDDGEEEEEEEEADDDDDDDDDDELGDFGEEEMYQDDEEKGS